MRYARNQWTSSRELLRHSRDVFYSKWGETSVTVEERPFFDRLPVKIKFEVLATGL